MAQLKAQGIPKAFVDRFWSYVDRGSENDCWLWTGARNRDGYGCFRLPHRGMATASRLALILATGEDAGKRHVLHRCDNPPCCNPSHLYFGTNVENVADKVGRGRQRTGDQRGERNGAAKLSASDLATIVARFRAGWSNVKIAEDLPVSHSMVSKIRRGHMWRIESAALGWGNQPAERIAERPCA